MSIGPLAAVGRMPTEGPNPDYAGSGGAPLWTHQATISVPQSRHLTRYCCIDL